MLSRHTVTTREGVEATVVANRFQPLMYVHHIRPPEREGGC